MKVLNVLDLVADDPLLLA